MEGGGRGAGVPSPLQLPGSLCRLLGPEESLGSQERKPVWTQTLHRRTLHPCGVQGAPCLDSPNIF